MDTPWFIPLSERRAHAEQLRTRAASLRTAAAKMADTLAPDFNDSRAWDSVHDRNDLAERMESEAAALDRKMPPAAVLFLAAMQQGTLPSAINGESLRARLATLLGSSRRCADRTICAALHGMNLSA